MRKPGWRIQCKKQSLSLCGSSGFVARALMLLGADEISTLEAGGIRTIRSLAQILTLYGADPKPWATAMPAWTASIAVLVISWPGWAVFAVIGGALGLAARPRD